MGLISRVSSRTYRDRSYKIKIRMSLRPQVINLYKRLLYLGHDWPAPQGYPWFRTKVNKAFSANKNETDNEKIENLIKRGEFVEKEIQTLYYLKKYRKLKERYMGED